jgi:uncharacterized protein (TIGR02246 family)
MPRIPAAISLAAALLSLAACGAPRFNPDDPAVAAQIDSLLKTAMDGAAHADADKTLSIAEGPGELTMITGDVMLSGLDSMKTQFRKTYSGIKSQQQSISQKRVRLLSPDVAVLMAVGEGTYTDKAGWTSPPVGLGLTVVFVREHGAWQAQHIHQSIAF